MEFSCLTFTETRLKCDLHSSQLFHNSFQVFTKCQLYRSIVVVVFQWLYQLLSRPVDLKFLLPPMLNLLPFERKEIVNSYT